MIGCNLSYSPLSGDYLDGDHQLWIDSVEDVNIFPEIFLDEDGVELNDAIVTR